MKPKAIIIDIDGTLANIDHRRHFVDPTDNDDECFSTECNCPTWKPDWKSFNEQMVNDTPNEWCVEIIDAFERQQVHHIEDDYYVDYDEFQFLFVTGREEIFKKITVEQIDKWTQLYSEHYKLFMRPTKDYRPDTVIKKEIYETHIKDKYDVLFCIDDRASVCEMWRDLGITVLQCAKGDF